MKPYEPTPRPQAAAVPPSDDSSLTHLQRTMLHFYRESSPEFLDEIRNMKLKPSTMGGEDNVTQP